MARKKKENPLTETIWVRLDEETDARLEALAKARHTTKVALVREAILVFLAGSPEKYLSELQEKLETDRVLTPGDRNVVRWMRSLDVRVRRRVFEIGEALQDYLRENGKLPAPAPPD